MHDLPLDGSEAPAQEDTFTDTSPSLAYNRTLALLPSSD
jgi:hypothetical protein